MWLFVVNLEHHLKKVFMKLTFSLLLSFLIFTSTYIFSQSALKGNKIVSIQNREVSYFDEIEVLADVDVYLFQGNNHFVSVETDENLQNSVLAKVDNGILKITFTDKIAKRKTMKIFVTLTKDLHTISAHKKANIYADSRLIVNKLTINAFDNADFEMKIDADTFIINGYKNTDLNFDVFSKDLKTFISESSELKLQGEIDSLSTQQKDKSVLTVKGKGLKLAIDAKNKSTFKGADFKVENATITANSNTNLTVNVRDSLKISAEKNARISIYQDPKLEIEQLAGKAKIYKKKDLNLF